MGRGCSQMVGDTLQMIPDGEQFADLRVYMMAPYDEDHLLIATRQEGLYLYDGTSAVPFPTEVDALWRDYRLYFGRGLPDDHFALTFLDGGGAVIIDKQGRLVQRFDESIGLPDGWVNYIFSDVQGGLWLALNNDGIVRVDYSSPLSFYDRKLGLEGRINDIERHQNMLYVATTTGVYQFGKAKDDAGRSAFTKVLQGTSRALLSTDSVLFAGTDEGLYLFGEGDPETLTDDVGAVLTLFQSSISEEVYFGLEDGFSVLAPTSQGWEVRSFEGAITEPVASVAEEHDGTLWLSTADRKVLRLRSADDGLDVESFDKEDGLPEEGAHPVLGINEVVFSSINGIYRYHSSEPGRSTASFYLDEALTPAPHSAPDPLLSFSIDEKDAFWLVYPNRVEIATPQADGTYARTTPPVLRFPKGEVVPIHIEEDGVAWLGDGNRLIRYDPHFQKKYDTPFTALIRTVTSGAGQPIFGGAYASEAAEGTIAELEYVHHDIRFTFAAPSYNAVNENQYQYYLEGYDAGWSDWTYRKSQPYYGLSEGRYTFRVQARNAQGVVSEEASFGFRILPPWYRTWGSYGFYFILILGATGLYWRYRNIVEENRQAQKQTQELAHERVINERLQQANRRLQEANEGLMMVNKLKDEFLATTSHELRTPLTAILGFAAVLQEELPGRFREFVDPIESNGYRLLQTVNSLLELAKLRSGMMEIHPEVINVGALVEEVNRLLAPLAYRKDLLLEFRSPPQPLLVNLDRRFLERILNNLVGNAIKFTEEGTVSVRVEGTQERVIIRVADTGIGIDESFVPELFDEFKQESSGLSRSHEGSGLGLSITARLVDLMDGTIHVESEKGRGTIFTVSFPMHRPPSAHPPVEQPAPSLSQPVVVP